MASAEPSGRTRGPKLEAYQVIKRPLITEKATHQSSHHAAYPFEVNPWATKDEIKHAVEEMFNVKVARVRTANCHGKKRRFRNHVGNLSNWKKAIVTLKPDSPAIEFF
jgi:large subunit ribosomal protein L23